MNLVRDPDYINSLMSIEKREGGAVSLSKKAIIEFPSWYEDKGLLEIGDRMNLYGVFAIIVDGKYAVSVIPTWLVTSPVMVKTVERDGEEYTQFIYGPGDSLIESTRAVKKDLLSYTFFEAHVVRAKMPWYLGYEDLVRVFDRLEPYAKSKLGNSYVASELVCSFIARQPSDKRKFYRQLPKGKPEYVDLMNVYYAATTTLTKIGGNQFMAGLTAALVQKEKKPSKLEKHVRQ